jgi:hypothetical protein
MKFLLCIALGFTNASELFNYKNVSVIKVQNLNGNEVHSGHISNACLK